MNWARRVSERYSSDAEIYRDLSAPLLRPHGEELLASLPLSFATRVVDVGTGCGTLLAGIQSRAPSALVVGIDRAPGILQDARRRLGCMSPEDFVDQAEIIFATAIAA